MPAVYELHGDCTDESFDLRNDLGMNPWIVISMKRLGGFGAKVRRDVFNISL